MVLPQTIFHISGKNILAFFSQIQKGISRCMGTRTGEITLPFLLLSPFHWGYTLNLLPLRQKFFPLRVDQNADGQTRSSSIKQELLLDSIAHLIWCLPIMNTKFYMCDLDLQRQSGRCCCYPVQLWSSLRITCHPGTVNYKPSVCDLT